VDGTDDPVSGGFMDLDVAQFAVWQAARHCVACSESLQALRLASEQLTASVYNNPDFRRPFMDVRSLQRPLKDQYRQDSASSRITLTARGSQSDAPIACSVDLGRAIYNAQAHKGVGGAGTGACSGDLLLGALAACAQITCQMVAAAMGIPTEGIDVTVEGDLDLQGTLGISKDVPVGFQSIRVIFDIRAPQATEQQLSALQAKTEQYCVVMQTLQSPPKIEHTWSRR
jgi:uncharacterized OsmC-like protein